MANAVTKLEPAALKPPDMSAPVQLKYWRCVDMIGTLTQRDVTMGGVVNDGGTQGRVRSIWFYPNAGYAVAELEVGWQPTKLESEQKIQIQRLILTQGHGREL